MEINEEEIDKKIKNINYTIDNLNNIINNINKKVETINTIYMNYEYNKNLNLNQTNTYLKFQVNLLNNEKMYYSNIKKFFIRKFTNDLYNILDHVIIILVSMNDLDIGFKDEKKKLFKQILRFSKIRDMNKAKVIELINVTINNVKIIKNFTNLFEKYIENNVKTNKANNIHSKSLKINLMNKKKHYDLEYNTYLEQLIELINYFDDYSKSINKQQENQDILKFFIDDKN
jgi:hypothetical protein